MTHVTNWPLMTTTIDHIIDHPDQHDQGEWSIDLLDEDYNFCGTARCVAGWAGHFTGHTVYEGGRTDVLKLRHNAVPPFKHVSDVAREELGLNLDDSNALFRADNTLADILELVIEWADEDKAEIPQRWRDIYAREVVGAL